MLMFLWCQYIFAMVLTWLCLSYAKNRITLYKDVINFEMLFDLAQVSTMWVVSFLYAGWTLKDLILFVVFGESGIANG